MIRRLIVAGAVSAAGFGGLVVATAPAAHAATVCVNAQLNVAGNQVLDQSQCQSTPTTPAPPALP